MTLLKVVHCLYSLFLFGGFLKQFGQELKIGKVYIVFRY